VTERIEKILHELTLDEKAALTAGTDMWHGTGSERLGFRGLKVSDGPNGARGSYFVGTTSACLPCGTAVAAMWNTDLVEQLGHLIGVEAGTKGADILLAPTVNIHRSPLAGRNFECYSEDPFLAARTAVAYITGVQAEGIVTTVKHFAANESEFERHTISSEVGERALREVYLPPFEAAITEAHSRSIMAAYNRLNGTYCSEHEWLIDDVLIGEWGFDGFVISDWWSVKSTVGTGLHGVDLEMPGPFKYLGAALAKAVRDGEVPEDAIDQKLLRLLGVMDDLGVLDEASHRPDESIDRPEDRALLRRAASEAVVLLSNDGVLPLDTGTLTSVAVIGPNADVPIIQGGGSAAVNPHHSVTILDGLRARLGDGVRITHQRGCDSFRSAPPLDPRWTADGSFLLDYFDNRELEGDPVHSQAVGSARLNWLGDPWPGVRGGNFSARLTATFVAPEAGDFTFSLVAGGRGRVFLDGEQVLDMWDQWRPGTAFFGLGSEEIRTTVTLEEGERRELRMDVSCMEKLPAAAGLLGCIGPMAADPIAAAAAAAADADVAVVVVGLNMEWETEGTDRVSMDLPGQQDELIRAVADANPRTVVLVNAGSPTSMPWVDDVGAVAQMWYLGQESGDAVADLLVGDVSPSGHLPTTFPRRYEDHPAVLNYPGELGEVHYGEGIFVGYRAFDRMGIEPRFPFGHGLSYTTFEYGQASVDIDTIVPDGSITVSVPVTNSGARPGAEVVQVYVADPVSRLVRPPQELKGFAKVALQPGETATVQIELNERAFSYWDPTASGWVCEAGDFELRVGSSSRDIRTTVAVSRVAP
jgi:beta-glucosidase